MITTYKAEVTRAQKKGEGHWWMISVPEIDGVTQARKLEEVEVMARDLIAITLDVELDEVAVEISGIEDTWTPRHTLRCPQDLWDAVKAKAKTERTNNSAVAIRAYRRYVGWDN